jgi:EmrB/QacA subfamily drug resistance transporter
MSTVTARPPATERLGVRAWLGLAVVLLAAFMQLLDATIVTVAAVPIQDDLDASYSQLQWLLAGYQLAFAVGLITGGRLGDVHGRRRMFLIGVVAFTLASLLCGLAPTATALVVLRLVQGATAALMFPQVTAIIHTSFTGGHRARAFGALGATIGLAGLAGPLVGGSLIGADPFGLGWRSIFLINLPVGVLATIGALVLVRESRAEQRPRLDLVGSLLGTVGLVLLVYPIVQGREHDWAGWIWALLGCAVLVLAVFVLHQRARQASGSPLIDFRVFERGSAFGIGIVAVFALFSGVSALFFVLAIYLQGGFGFSALETGLAFTPIALASTLSAGISIPLVGRFGKVVVQIGAALMFVGVIGLMVILDRNTGDITIGELLPAQLLIGAGLGAAVSTINNISLAEARGPSAGSAAGLQSTMGQLGNAVGVAILGALFFSLLAANVDRSVDHAVPRLRADLAAAGLPAASAEQIVTGFRTCLADRGRAKDPTAVPASCRRFQPDTAAAPTDPAVAAAVGSATRDALQRDFSTSLRLALYYELVTLALVIGLVFALPRRTATELADALPGGAH